MWINKNLSLTYSLKCVLSFSSSIFLSELIRCRYVGVFLYAPLIDFDTAVTTAGPKARFGDLITSLMQSSGKAGWGGAQEQKNTGRKHKTQIQEDRSGRTVRSALCKPFFSSNLFTL